MNVVGICEICNKEILEDELDRELNEYDFQYHKKCIDLKLDKVWNKIENRIIRLNKKINGKEKR